MRGRPCRVTTAVRNPSLSAAAYIAAFTLSAYLLQMLE